MKNKHHATFCYQTVFKKLNKFDAIYSLHISKVDNFYCKLAYFFQIRDHEKLIKNSPLLILDGNLTKEALTEALKLADKYSVPGKGKCV